MTKDPFPFHRWIIGACGVAAGGFSLLWALDPDRALDLGARLVGPARAGHQATLPLLGLGVVFLLVAAGARILGRHLADRPAAIETVAGIGAALLIPVAAAVRVSGFSPEARGASGIDGLLAILLASLQAPMLLGAVLAIAAAARDSRAAARRGGAAIATGGLVLLLLGLLGAA